MNSIIHVINEIWTNRKRMLRIVRYDIKIESRSAYLGSLWEFIVPLIQIGTFWLVFGIGIRGGEPINGTPFILWLLAGLVPWFFFNRGITGGSSSIVDKAGVIFKIKYPISTVPIGAVLRCLYTHVIFIGILLIIFLFYGMRPEIYWLSLVYYILFTTFFLSALAMVSSVIVRLATDFKPLIASLMQILFFLTPIVWHENYLPNWVLRIFSANPVRYVVMGFRGSLLEQNHFFEFPWRIAFFWSVTFVLFIFGCWLQKKFSHRFVDWT